MQRDFINRKKKLENKLQKEGFILISGYKNFRTPILTSCLNNHVATRLPQDFLRMGCRICKKEKRIHRYVKALEKSGFSLVTNYKGVDVPNNFRCKRGHLFDQRLYNLFMRKKCPECIRERYLLVQQKQLKELDLKKKKETKIFITALCKENHLVKIKKSKISKFTSCAICRKNSENQKKINRIRSFVSQKGAILISKNYRGAFSKIRIKCQFSHYFEITPDNLLNGKKWCSECSCQSLGEAICRKFFEIAYSANFPKKKPIWLKSEDNKRLELDGYNEMLGIAFEHNGRQHYGMSLFTSTKKKLDILKRNDRRKKYLCKINGVILVEIPQIHSASEIMNAGLIIAKEIRRKKLNPPALKDAVQESYLKLKYRNNLFDVAKMAEKKTGDTLLSKSVLSQRLPVKWKCKSGHMYEQSLTNKIHQGSGCPKCYDLNRSGEKAPRAKLTQTQANRIRTLKSSKTRKELADQFSVSVNIIKNIWAGKTYRENLSL